MYAVCMHVRTCVCEYVSMCVCVYVCMSVCVFLHVCVYICIRKLYVHGGCIKYMCAHMFALKHGSFTARCDVRF